MRVAARAKPKLPLEYNLLLTATLCLLALGAVMVYSASSARTLLQGDGDGTTYLVRYVAYGGVGFVALHVIARRGLDSVVALTGPLLAFSFACLVAVKLPGLGVTVNGARRWLGAGPLTFQPSEVAKLALVLYGAKFLAQKPGRIRTPRDAMPLLLVAGTMLLLVASQPDLGTALVIAFTLTALLVAGGFPVRYLLIGAGAAAFLVTVYAISEPYRRARLTTFIDPWSHAGGAGFQAVQGQIALGSGGLFGRGIGQSVQKIFYLPEAHTDFILAIIGEELGVAGVTAVLFLYGLLAYAGLRVAKARQGRLRQAAGGRHHLAHPQPGVPERLRRPGAGAADRRAAALHLLRSDEPHRAAGRHGAAAQRRGRGQCPSARRGRIPPPWLRRSSSPRAGQRGTWCRRWPSPTRCGLTARTSSSSAASAPSARWCPRPATSCARSPSRG